MNYNNYKAIYRLFGIVVFAFLLVSCANENNIYNKSASYWYEKITKAIATNALDDADDFYVSLASEHRLSPYTKSAILLLGDAYMQNEQYIMANYYYDEYLEKFSNSQMSEYIKFLKIKSKMLSFKSRFREQYLINGIINDIDRILIEYDNFAFKNEVLDYKTRLLITRSKFNGEISALYGRVGKQKAQKYYENKQILHHQNVTIESRNFLRRVFN